MMWNYLQNLSDLIFSLLEIKIKIGEYWRIFIRILYIKINLKINSKEYSY